MGFFDFLKRTPEKVKGYAPTGVTEALKRTLPLWNDLLRKYPQTPRAIYARSSTEAETLSIRLAAGIQILLNGLADAKRRSQEVDPEEKEMLRKRFQNFKVKKEMLDLLIDTEG